MFQSEYIIEIQLIDNDLIEQIMNCGWFSSTNFYHKLMIMIIFWIWKLQRNNIIFIYDWFFFEKPIFLKNHI